VDGYVVDGYVVDGHVVDGYVVDGYVVDGHVYVLSIVGLYFDNVVYIAFHIITLLPEHMRSHSFLVGSYCSNCSFLL
jgi:hypothetical protein